MWAVLQKRDFLHLTFEFVSSKQMLTKLSEHYFIIIIFLQFSRTNIQLHFVNSMDEPLLNAIFFSNLSQCHCSKIDWFYHLAHSQRWKFKYWESKNAQSKVQLWKNKLTNKQIRVLIIPPPLPPPPLPVVSVQDWAWAHPPLRPPCPEPDCWLLHSAAASPSPPPPHPGGVSSNDLHRRNDCDRGSERGNRYCDE